MVISRLSFKQVFAKCGILSNNKDICSALFLSSNVMKHCDLKFCSSSTQTDGNQDTDLVSNNSNLISSLQNPFLVASDHQTVEQLEAGLILIPDFINEEEEENLFAEVNPYLRKLRYEKSHWDDAIHDYRETEKREWNENNSSVIQRLRAVAFPGEGLSPQQSYVHVLDVSAKGFIKPHVDSVRFCGTTVAGISLLTDSVMRFVKEADKNWFGDLLLPQRSLYIMKDDARYLYTHEICKDEESYFKQQRIPKGRRISIICRNSPTHD